MKNGFFIIFFALSFSFLTTAQTLLVEDFNYAQGSLLTANGWTNHSGTSNFIPVGPGLTYAGFPGSNIGGGASLLSTGEDVNRHINGTDSITTGSVYVSMMVRVDIAQTGDYFFHISSNAINTSFYRARVFVKAAAGTGKIAFGVAKGTTSATVLPTYTDTVNSTFSTGTTYLLVLKYAFVTGGANNDVVSLFVNPVLGAAEPAPNATHSDTSTTGADLPSFGTVILRQGSTASAPTMTVDGIRVAQSWAAVLPVELSSFYSNVVGNNVTLNWTTASEINNREFVIERNINGSWNAIGSVTGAGTSTITRSYSFTDKNVSANKASYRLRQVDFDGSIHYSNAIEVNIGSADQFGLNQNYPNPFNPSTTLSYTIVESGFVSLNVYDQIGNNVASLVNANQEAGAYTLQFDGSKLSSGIYYIQLRSNGQTSVIKASLMK